MAVSLNMPDQIFRTRRFEDASLDVEGLGGDRQTLGDLLEDFSRRAPQPAFYLGEVGVRDPRKLRESP